MAFLESLLAAAATKAGVAAAGVALTVSGVGAAAVTGNLPADIQTQVDELIGTERGDDGDETGTTDAGELETTEVVGEELEGDDAGAADEGVGSDVSEAVANVDPTLEGRERGEAVSDAARTANGSSDQGQADARREEAATRAEAGQANADGAADEAD
ncbi:MAG: hypothetical protein KY461_08510, partial [Actinobacteria bacterium]|nr:hypothetical protein [Actinomycetota bacterium]